MVACAWEGSQNDDFWCLDLAQSMETSDGVTFVPALCRPAAPHWNEQSTGTVAMQADCGMQLVALRADGGASSNSFLMQLQADLLGCPVERAMIEEIGALGAAAMAFGALGVEWSADTGSERFDPVMPSETADTLRSTWRAAIARACS